MNETETSPTELQLDALREVANVGCGHAANALSRLVGGRRVQVEVPRALFVKSSELPEMLLSDGGSHVAATVELRGDMGGRLVLALPKDDALRLCALLLGSEERGGLEEDERSAFSETANILASACLTAIGQLTGLNLLLSVPTVAQEGARTLVRAGTNGSSHLGLVLEARFSAAGEPPIEGQLLLLPDRASLRRLLERLGL